MRTMLPSVLYWHAGRIGYEVTHGRTHRGIVEGVAGRGVRAALLATPDGLRQGGICGGTVFPSGQGHFSRVRPDAVRASQGGDPGARSVSHARRCHGLVLFRAGWPSAATELAKHFQGII